MNITSKENPRIKHLEKLIASKEYRYEKMEFVIEGERLFDSSDEVLELFIMDGARPPKIKARKTYNLESKLFKKIASTENTQGLIAVKSFEIKDAGEIRPDRNYILLDRVQDPGNAGTIIRTALAFGVHGIIITDGTCDPFSPKTVRSSAGAILKTEIIKLKDINTLRNFNLVAADRDGRDILEYQWPANFILAIGNEAGGLSESLCACAKEEVRIPISKEVESLNASIACAIMLFQAAKNTIERNR